MTLFLFFWMQRSKMNYRAWNHRCWLVSYMTREQVLHELKKSRNWAGLHVADNCCFHYRRVSFLMNLNKLQCKFCVLSTPLHRQGILTFLDTRLVLYNLEKYTPKLWRMRLEFTIPIVSRLPVFQNILILLAICQC